MSDPVIVTIHDVRHALNKNGRGFCVSGLREWFKHHQIDFGNFIREGYPLSQVETIDDQFARTVVAYVRSKAEVTE
jgi:hypothetical protein